MNPYMDQLDLFDKNLFVRIFNEVPEEELIWHRDKRNREITVLESEGWKLQMDNELPVLLEVGKTFHIENMSYHRLLKGKGPLVLQILEK